MYESDVLTPRPPTPTDPWLILKNSVINIISPLYHLTVQPFHDSLHLIFNSSFNVWKFTESKPWNAAGVLQLLSDTIASILPRPLFSTIFSLISGICLGRQLTTTPFQLLNPSAIPVMRDPQVGHDFTSVLQNPAEISREMAFPNPERSSPERWPLWPSKVSVCQAKLDIIMLETETAEPGMSWPVPWDSRIKCFRVRLIKTRAGFQVLFNARVYISVDLKPAFFFYNVHARVYILNRLALV